MDDKYRSPYERGRLALVERILPFGPGRALDLGCGSGIVSEMLGARGFHVLGIDSDAAAIAAAKRRVPAATFTVGDAVAADVGGGNFDLIVACELIEHLDLDHQRALLRRILALLRPNGALVLSTPNRRSLMSVVGSIMYPLQGRRWDWGDSSHVLVHSSGSLRRLLGQAGFAIDSEWGFQLLLHRPAFTRPLSMRAYRGVLGSVCYDIVLRARSI
jgi:SAM-dependent methyltransferase